jgi:hypothetical protein
MRGLKHKAAKASTLILLGLPERIWLLLRTREGEVACDDLGSEPFNLNPIHL